MIVIDTNIMAYLLIEGSRTSACRDVYRQDPEWAAPLLWRSVFRNVLTTHMRHTGMTLDGAMARMEEAERLIAGRDYTVSTELVLTLTDGNSVSAYDAEYICLAKDIDTRLVTTDRKLLKSFPDIAVGPESFVSQTP